LDAIKNNFSPYDFVAFMASAYNQKTFPRKRASILSVAFPDIARKLKHRATLTSQGLGRPNGRPSLKRYASHTNI
jgi:hypothetical protein